MGDYIDECNAHDVVPTLDGCSVFLRCTRGALEGFLVADAENPDDDDEPVTDAGKKRKVMEMFMSFLADTWQRVGLSGSGRGASMARDMLAVHFEKWKKDAPAGKGFGDSLAEFIRNGGEMLLELRGGKDRAPVPVVTYMGEGGGHEASEMAEQIAEHGSGGNA